MNHATSAPAITYTLIIGLIVIVWRLYIRFRRSVGRQLFRARRPWISVILFPLLTVFMTLTLVSVNAQLALLALLGGAAVGVGLAIYGLRLTRFEVTPGGLYYTPNAHIGIALSLLFIGRIAYRFLQMGGMFPGTGASMSGAPPSPGWNSPFTLLFFGPLAGYYTTYAIGLLRWRASLTTPAAQPAEPQ